MSRTVLCLAAILALPSPAWACQLDHTTYEEPFTGTLFVVDAVHATPGSADAVLVGRMTTPDGSRASKPIALEIGLPGGLVKSGWKEGDAEMTALLQAHPAAPADAMPAPPARLHFEEITVFSPRLEDNFGELKASGCREPEQAKPGPT